NISRKYESLEHILAFKKMVEDAGLKLYHCGYPDYNDLSFHLGLPDRDEKLERYREFIRNLGKADIFMTTYAWTPGGVFRTTPATVRGCRTGAFDVEEYRKKPLLRERTYTDEELWDNYKYFMDRILPVAEEAGVKMQLHPGDPPIDFNIPRIFRTTESYRRNFEICRNSLSASIRMCVGTWGEMAGPEGKGEDVVAAIRHFGKAGKISGVHFRNVSGPLPHFVETFMDNGYLDMYRVMKALVEVDFQGILAPDHVPSFTNEARLGPMGVSGAPYSIGYIRALLQAAQAEAG
ncbi:MAG: mannonate dehydratase, partial [Candidatus Latescibacterota bacterium]